jgi:hypothetical protein
MKGRSHYVGKELPASDELREIATSIMKKKSA